MLSMTRDVLVDLWCLGVASDSMRSLKEGGSSDSAAMRNLVDFGLGPGIIILRFERRVEVLMGSLLP